MATIQVVRGGLLSAARSRAGDVAHKRRVWPVTVAGWRWVRPLIGSAAALACFVVAAFMAATVAGLVVTGVSLLVLDWYSRTPECQGRRQRR